MVDRPWGFFYQEEGIVEKMAQNLMKECMPGKGCIGDASVSLKPR